MIILYIIGGLMAALLLLALAPLAVILALVCSGLLLMAFWIWSLINAIQNKGLTDGEKTGWVLAIVFFHFIGSTLYFFLGRPKQKLAVQRQIGA